MVAAKAAPSRGRSRQNLDPRARHKRCDIYATTIAFANTCNRHRGKNYFANYPKVACRSTFGRHETFLL